MSGCTIQNKDFDYKRFLGLTTASEVERLVYEVARKTKLDMASRLEEYHKKYEDDQKALEASFKLGDIKRVNVNFWDDFYDDGYVPVGEVTETYAYIEDSSIPDIECHKLLSKLMSHIEDRCFLPSSVKMRMHLFDSTAKYPGLIDEHEYMLNKRWEIQITNITHKQLDELMCELKTYSDGPEFNIYSES